MTMVTVELTDEEAALLAERLEWLVSETRMEMCDTDQADFREALRREKSVLERVIAQLKAEAAA